MVSRAGMDQDAMGVKGEPLQLGGSQNGKAAIHPANNHHTTTPRIIARATMSIGIWKLRFWLFRRCSFTWR